MATTMFAAQGGKRKVLYVIIDGVENHFLEMAHPPTIYDIANTGLFGKAFCGGEIGRYSQSPTISAIGYTNILTGTWMNKHNVLGNSNIQTNYNYWSIFRIAKNQKREVKTAVFTSWTDNTTLLIGKGRAETDQLKIDYVYDGYDTDTVRFPRKPMDLHIMEIDSVICQNAAQCVRQQAPDLSWVYLWYPDDAFHIRGFGDFAKDVLLREDGYLSHVWDAIRYRESQFQEDWMVIVTTDHGRTEDGHHHGGQSESERATWIATNRKDVNSHFRSETLSQVDINPTICRFMDFDVLADVAWEQDGMPFIGSNDIEDARAFGYNGNSVILRWKALNSQAMVDIYFSETDHYKSGGKDNWHHAAQVSAAQGSYRIDLSSYPSSKFFKFALVTPNGHLARIYQRQ